MNDKLKLINKTITSIEFIVSEKCQNDCVYCYRRAYHNRSKFIDIDSYDFEYLVDKTLEFVGNQDRLKNEPAELFGGDGFLHFDKHVKYLEILTKKGFKKISCPTNTRMLCEISDHDLDFIVNKYNVHYSLSVDSLVCENNRKLSRYGKMLAYNDVINYDRIFHLVKKYRFGLHPMFDFKDCDKWYDQFLFFYENGVINGLHFYMLEIRHHIPDINRIPIAVEQMYKILLHIKKTNGIAKLFNTLSPSYVSRGIGCSLQTTLTVNYDGNCYVCHRLIYPQYRYANVFNGYFNKDIFMNYFIIYDHRNVFPCVICPIRKLCSGQCLGASFELTGGCETYIDTTICVYNLLKMYMFIKFYEDYDKEIFRFVLNSIDYDLLKKMLYQYFDENILKPYHLNK